MLTTLKKEISWLNEINSQSLQHSLVELDKAFRSFFKHNTAYPAFKSKFKAKENRLVIPKFNEGVKYRDKYTIPENIKDNVGVPLVLRDLRQAAPLGLNSTASAQLGCLPRNGIPEAPSLDPARTTDRGFYGFYSPGRGPFASRLSRRCAVLFSAQPSLCSGIPCLPP